MKKNAVFWAGLLSAALGILAGACNIGINPPVDIPQRGRDTQADRLPAGAEFELVKVGKGIPYHRDPDNQRDETAENSSAVLTGYTYWIGTTEVTTGLWRVVLGWALENGYAINDGKAGSTEQEPRISGTLPITRMSWYDAVVWCNALTEWHNQKYQTAYEPVYRTLTGEIIRDSGKSTELAYMNMDQVRVDAVDSLDGFRLPFNLEWELAARYVGPEAALARLGFLPDPEDPGEVLDKTDFMADYDTVTDPDGVVHYFTPQDYASGARIPVDYGRDTPPAGTKTIPELIQDYLNNTIDALPHFRENSETRETAWYKPVKERSGQNPITWQNLSKGTVLHSQEDSREGYYPEDMTVVGSNKYPARAQPAAWRRPNSLGIYDMSGNVWEWCYDSKPGTERLRRGGSFQSPCEYITAANVRAPDNSGNHSTYNYLGWVSPVSDKLNDTGFRIARTERAEPAEPAGE